jgi:hypothetical protein
MRAPRDLHDQLPTYSGWGRRAYRSRSCPRRYHARPVRPRTGPRHRTGAASASGPTGQFGRPNRRDQRHIPVTWRTAATKRAFTAAASAASVLAEEIRNDHPNLRVGLTGMVMTNRAFQESSQHDGETLYPLVFTALIILPIIGLRSVNGLLSVFFVIIAAVLTALGV